MILSMTVKIEDSNGHWQGVVSVPTVAPRVETGMPEEEMPNLEETTQPQGSGWIDLGRKVKRGKVYYYPAFRWYRGGKRSCQGWMRIYPHQLQAVANSIRSGKPAKETLQLLRGGAC